jgi:hypothetical protein
VRLRVPEVDPEASTLGSSGAPAMRVLARAWSMRAMAAARSWFAASASAISASSSGLAKCCHQSADTGTAATEAAAGVLQAGWAGVDGRS